MKMSSSLAKATPPHSLSLTHSFATHALSLYTKEQGRTLELDRERIGEVKKEEEDNH